MRWMWLALIVVLVGCGANNSTPIDTVETAIGEAQSAVVHLNITGRTTTINPLIPPSDILFSANVGHVDTVSYVVDESEQTFILMTDASETPTDDNWQIQTNPTIPTSYVVDVFGSDLAVDLSQSDIPRFDILASDSTLNLTMPAMSSQLAIDASDTTTTLTIPDGADLPSAQFINTGGLMTIDVASGAIFSGTMTVSAGGIILNVANDTGVQVIVSSSINSEISLPEMARIPAEIGIYETDNFATSDNQILLTVALDNASIRISQE